MTHIGRLLITATSLKRCSPRSGDLVHTTFAVRPDDVAVLDELAHDSLARPHRERQSVAYVPQGSGAAGIRREGRQHGYMLRRMRSCGCWCKRSWSRSAQPRPDDLGLLGFRHQVSAVPTPLWCRSTGSNTSKSSSVRLAWACEQRSSSAIAVVEHGGDCCARNSRLALTCPPWWYQLL